MINRKSRGGFRVGERHGERGLCASKEGRKRVNI